MSRVGLGWNGAGRSIRRVPGLGQPRQMTGKAFNARKAPPPTSAILNTDYAANFTDFLDTTSPDRPWCFWYGAVEPHRGYEFGSGVAKGGKKLSDIDRVPAYWPDNETVRNDMLDYAFEVEHFDRHLGRMLAELERRGHVIDVGVGDEDVRHRLAAHGLEHGLDMILLIGARIDDRHLAVTDDVGAGALEGEGAGIAGDDAADQRRHFHRRAVVELEVLDEGNAGHLARAREA